MKLEVKLEFGGHREKKSDLVQYGGEGYFLGLPSVSPARIRSYIEAYKVSEVVRACIDKINLAGKSVPWYLYERTGQGPRMVEKHALVNVRRQPSQVYSWPKFLERVLGFYLISGNRYVHRYVGSFRTYAELDCLAPHRVTIKTNALGEPAYYEYRDTYRSMRIELEDMLHSKMFNPADDLYGLSPIATVASQVDISHFAAEWSIRLLQNSARPGGVLFVNGSLSEEQRADLKKDWKENHQGPESTGNLLIVETGVGATRPGDLKLMSYSPKELELPASEKNIVRKVCSVLHVPPELLGDAENKTYSNQKEARKALYQDATLPYLAEFRDELNAWLVPELAEGRDLYFDYDVSGVDALAADATEVWTRLGGAVDRGIIHRNEAREEMRFGKSTEPGMDKPTVAANVLPIDVVAAGGGEPE